MDAPFSLNGITTTLTATTTRDTDTLGANTGRVRVVSEGPNYCRIKSGVSEADAAAATTDTPFAPGAIEVMSIPSNHTHVSAICATGSVTIHFQTGTGI